jgi:hypothetical protein
MVRNSVIGTDYEVIISDNKRLAAQENAKAELSTEEKLQVIDMYIGSKLETAADIPEPEEQLGKFLHFVSGVGSLKDVLVLVVSLFKDQDVTVSKDLILPALKQFCKVSFIQEPEASGMYSLVC